MWYKTAQEKQKLEHFYNLLKANPDFNSTKRQFLELSQQIGEFHVDRRALQDAYKQISDEYLTRYREQKKTNPSQQSTNNTSTIPPTSQSTPQTNTTVKDLTLDKADKLERLRPEDKSGDLIPRPEGGELDLYKPKEDEDPDKPKKDDASCIIEEEVFIQNILTGLTGYAQIYFKKKIFTISQDTYGGNRSPLAPVQRALGLTPPGRLDPNTQAYDPASATSTNPLGDFARRSGPIRDSKGRIMTDASGAPLTMSAPTKDKTVVWNTADVQSIMSSLEKIAQMPELQKYGAKEIANILRYPLLQVKNEYEKIDEEKEKIDESIKEITDKIDELYEKMRENHYEHQQIEILKNDVSKPKTPAELLSLEAKQRKLIEDSRKLGPLELKYKENIVKLNSKKTKLDNIKPEVEVVPFKDFYKLTELSRYYIYKGSQLNEVFCKLEAQLIKTLDNTLNTLGKMEKNKRLKDIYENARGKK